MFVNSSGTENVSLSLTFLGKKVGRHRAVAPASKQRAWETTTLSPCSEDSVRSTRAGHTPVKVAMVEELPGSIPDLREEAGHQRPCPVHNTHLDQATAVVEQKAVWLRSWETFRRWIRADRKRDTGLEEQDTFSSNQKERNQEAQGGMDVKIYIPYESAELCITQIAEDMQTMKTRHQEMIQEMEENFLMASREYQDRTVQVIKSHYQNKLNALRRILDLYQEKVEKKNAQWEERVAAVSREKERLQEERGAERRRTREEALQWQREKSKMLELFSTRLDLLHCHQTSTLQELQMARQEVGKVQEMLMTSQQGTEQQAEPPSEDGEPSRNDGHGSEQPGVSMVLIQVRNLVDMGRSNSELPLEGAKARLEELKESLYQREREITELLEAEQSPIPAVSLPLPPCNTLLRAVIQKAHDICSVVNEARLLLDHMVKENRTTLAQTREQMDQTRMTLDDRYHRDEERTDPEWSELSSSLALQQQTVRDAEVVQMALDCIRSGASPAPTGCDPATELEEVLGAGEAYTTEGGVNIGQQLLLLQDQLKQVREENRKIVENYTSERTMRKKYYNMVEDMKGKIRVFCRIRPVSRAEAGQGGAIVVECLDDYSVTVETARGQREFQFDRVFSPESSQEDVFQDTNRLIQSAIDGYNVCIFAYGQTGSGKTFTMVGDKEQRNPGIMPRAFNAMFDIIQENASKFDFKVSAYMLELYNDRLQDLFVSGAEAQSRRVEIKRNRKGLVFAQGAETKEASSATELYALFQQACANRHISSTKMNVESSRSHLIVGIMVESTNLTNGSVSCGKLSLVDLAGSERAAKTGAKDDQLKEANSINKSLSALGDVISALSSELPHVPYRNSKLTQVMQDSLGGNAKTLMIANVSPSDCNVDETLTSLIYATRVKAITNNAQRNQDSKEIAQLKEVIVKLRSGQAVEEAEV